MNSDLHILMTENFQCPGCTHGSSTKDSCYNPSEFNCSNHSAGTFMGGVGNINLGLPKGFNRIGPMDKKIQKTNIRFLETLPEYNSFNMPLWALEENGYLFVVLALPRFQQFWVDIIPNGKVADLPSYVVNVSELDLSQCW